MFLVPSDFKALLLWMLSALFVQKFIVGIKSKIWNIESPIQSHKSNALYPPVSFQTFSLHVPEITFFPNFPENFLLIE